MFAFERKRIPLFFLDHQEGFSTKTKQQPISQPLRTNPKKHLLLEINATQESSRTNKTTPRRSIHSGPSLSAKTAKTKSNAHAIPHTTALFDLAAETKKGSASRPLSGGKPCTSWSLWRIALVYTTRTAVLALSSSVLAAGCGLARLSLTNHTEPTSGYLGPNTCHLFAHFPDRTPPTSTVFWGGTPADWNLLRCGLCAHLPRSPASRTLRLAYTSRPLLRMANSQTSPDRTRTRRALALGTASGQQLTLRHRFTRQHRLLTPRLRPL